MNALKPIVVLFMGYGAGCLTFAEEGFGPLYFVGLALMLAGGWLAGTLWKALDR